MSTPYRKKKYSDDKRTNDVINILDMVVYGEEAQSNAMVDVDPQTYDAEVRLEDEILNGESSAKLILLVETILPGTYTKIIE